MILSWMFAAIALGAITILAAAALERALRLLDRQGRWAWILALAATTMWPLLAPTLVRDAATSVEQRVLDAGPATILLEEAPTISRMTMVREMVARLDAPIALVWAIATALLLFRALLSVWSLRRLARGAERRDLDGQSVLISPSVGPAAFGVMNPHIVLPSWTFDLDAPMRTMVVRHEQEHIAASDPATLMLAWFCAALMPWNAALWIIARRLRLAAELDCDHRVVRQGVDARRYAQLLLLMAQRQGTARFAALIAGSPSTLHKRIHAMHATRPDRPRLRAAAFVALALVGSAFAASPALASELASVRVRLEMSPLMQEPTRQAPPKRTRADSAVKRAPADTVTRRITIAPSRRVPIEVEVRAAETEVELERRQAIEEREALRREAEVERELVRREVERERAAVREEIVAARARTELEQRAQRERIGVVRREAESERERAEVRERELTDRERELVARDREEREAERAQDRQGRPRVAEFVLDTQVVFAPGGSPTVRYPEILQSAGVSGVVVVQIVVDSSGLPMTASLKVLRTTHELFATSVRAVVPEMRFIAARVGGRNVRQLVQLVYRFRIQGDPPAVVEPITGLVRTLEVLVTAPPR